MVDIRPKDVAGLVLAWKNPSLCRKASRPEANLGKGKHPDPCRDVERFGFTLGTENPQGVHNKNALTLMKDLYGIEFESLQHAVHRHDQT